MRDEYSLIYELVLDEFVLFCIASVMNLSAYNFLLFVPTQNWDDL